MGKKGFPDLKTVLKRLMWRTTKKDVLHEINLPLQEEETIFLRFSPVEAYFYKKQHEECFNELSSLLVKRFQKKEKLIKPLLRLRQACCHPQVGSRGISTLQKNTMTMDQLLDQLILKAKVECEEAQRALIVSINGIAAIHLINENLISSVEAYKV
jgi:E3 ubiquitin-protein ligase SHPRH